MFDHLITLKIEEPFERRRKRELLAEIKRLDAALASLHGDIGEERRKSGLSVNSAMPTSLRSPKMQALMLGLTELSRMHSAALEEYATL